MAVTWKRGNLLDRPYDVAIPGNLIAKIKERRHSPDGQPIAVREKGRGSERVFVYPWRKMQLGDFFVAPIGDRSEKSMRTAFYQAAARHDFEIAVKPYKLPGGAPGLRVTLVIIGVKQYRIKSDEFTGKKTTISDGRWKQRHRTWEQERPTRARRPVKDDRPFKESPLPRKVKPSAEQVVFVEPTEHTSPEEVRRRLLAQLESENG